MSRISELGILFFSLSDTIPEILVKIPEVKSRSLGKGVTGNACFFSMISSVCLQSKKKKKKVRHTVIPPSVVGFLQPTTYHQHLNTDLVLLSLLVQRVFFFPVLLLLQLSSPKD